MVEDSSNQRLYDGYDKSDGYSLIVATDSISMTGVINTKEGRTVVILDIVNPPSTQQMAKEYGFY